MACGVVAVCLPTSGSALAQPVATAVPDVPAQGGLAESVYRKNTATVPAADQADQAERIVAAALTALGRAESISARVRQRVRVDDRVLVGAGRYVQSGLGEDHIN